MLRLVLCLVHWLASIVELVAVQWDTVPPVVTLVGASNVTLEFGATFIDPGAHCSDAVDGTSAATASATVDSFSLAIQNITYTCQDRSGNIATVVRSVLVRDSMPPAVILRGARAQCVSQGDEYVEKGAQCHDNFDGLFEASWTGTVNTSVSGTAVVVYTCADSHGNTASATANISVLAVPSLGNLTLLSLQLQNSANGSYAVAGVKSVLTNIHPTTAFKLQWSGPFMLGSDNCRSLTVLDSTSGAVMKQYGSLSLSGLAVITGQQLSVPQGPGLLLSAGLQDLKQYKVILDEHFVSSTDGTGSLRQEMSFATGDFSSPVVLATLPAPGDQAWSMSDDITVVFNEYIGPGSSVAFLRIRRTDNTSALAVPCNGSETAAGAQIRIRDGSRAVVTLGSWQYWSPCTDFQLDADAGCFKDLSLNQNPSTNLAVYQFVTSCVLNTIPPSNSMDVHISSQIVMTFAEAVQMGSGFISLWPVGEPPLVLNASDFPRVYTDRNALVVDLACTSKLCDVYSKQNSTGTTAGLCSGRATQHCKGKTMEVRVGAGALRLANRTWPAGSILAANSMAARVLPHRYAFTLRAADLTAPTFVSTDAAAVAEDTIRVTVRIDEGGTVHCAAFSNASVVPSRNRVLGLEGQRDAGASRQAPYFHAKGFAEATLHLKGLVASSNYRIYCFAEDSELPQPNVMSETTLARSLLVLTTLDRTPPTLALLQASTAGEAAVSITLQLSEPGVAYCAARPNYGRPPTQQEIVATGTRGHVGADLRVSLTVGGVLPDAEVNLYCTAHDHAGQHPDARQIDNWAPEPALLQRRANAHSAFDLTGPRVVATSPPHGGTVGCRPDGAAPGCLTTVNLTFNEDIYRGSGSVTFKCLAGSPLCNEVVAPIDDHIFPGGTSEIENRLLTIRLATPLADQSRFKLVVAAGALQDSRGNPFQMDVWCPEWFDPNWQAAAGDCPPAYEFRTP